MAEDTTSQREAPQSVATGGPDLRKLKRTMAIMSGVLVLSFMVVIAAFVWRLSGSGSREAALPSGDHFGVSRIAVAPGETVRSVTLDEERIAVHIGSDGAEAIIIVNVKTGEELGRILLTPMSGFASRE